MIVNNTSISSDGIVLNIDQGNTRSYKGPPLQNILNQISPSTGDNGSTYRFFSGTEDVYVPSVGTINNCQYVDMYNDYNGGSGNCCPAPYSYGGSLPVTGNTLYTYAILYRSANRYTNPNLMYHYEYNGGTYLTEFGVHNGGYPWSETDLGNGWYWSRAKFTSQPTATLFHTGSWMYQYATWNRLYVAKVMIVPGDYTSLHPKYWPDVNTTCSTTQTIVDLTGNNTLTANSLTYATDGTFSFNGTSDGITSSTTLFNRVSGDPMSVSVWIKPGRLGGQYQDIVVNRSDSLYNWMLYQHTNDGSIQLHGAAQNKSSYIPSIGSWIHVVATVDSSGTYLLYINGVVQQTVTGYSYANMTPSLLCIGKFGTANEFYQGSISNVSIYNRALTADQVTQNFNALRGRYGI